jgi:hypothetical protein
MAGCQGRNSQLAGHGGVTSCEHLTASISSALRNLHRVESSPRRDYRVRSLYTKFGRLPDFQGIRLVAAPMITAAPAMTRRAGWRRKRYTPRRPFIKRVHLCSRSFAASRGDFVRECLHFGRMRHSGSAAAARDSTPAIDSCPPAALSLGPAVGRPGIGRNNRW